MGISVIVVLCSMTGSGENSLADTDHLSVGVTVDTEDNAGAVDPMHPLIVFMAGASIIGGLAGKCSSVNFIAMYVCTL